MIELPSWLIDAVLGFLVSVLSVLVTWSMIRSKVQLDDVMTRLTKVEAEKESIDARTQRMENMIERLLAQQTEILIKLGIHEGKINRDDS